MRFEEGMNRQEGDGRGDDDDNVVGVRRKIAGVDLVALGDGFHCGAQSEPMEAATSRQSGRSYVFWWMLSSSQYTISLNRVGRQILRLEEKREERKLK